MKERFAQDGNQPHDKGKYKGDSSLEEHIKDCMVNWKRRGMSRD